MTPDLLSRCMPGDPDEQAAMAAELDRLHADHPGGRFQTDIDHAAAQVRAAEARAELDDELAELDAWRNRTAGPA